MLDKNLIIETSSHGVVTARSRIDNQQFFDNDNYVYGKTFVGVARYKYGDADDLDGAREIAISKMKRNFYKTMLNTARYCHRELMKSIISTEDSIDVCNNNIYNSTERIKRISTQQIEVWED